MDVEQARSRGWFIELFALTGRVNRRRYVVIGLVLAALKFAIEFALIKSASGKSLTLTAFVNPLLDERVQLLAGSRSSLMPLLFLAIPFLWIAVAMSMRRALDAGLPALCAILMFVPVVNLAAIAVLALWPSKALLTREPIDKPDRERNYAERSRFSYFAAIIAPCFVFFFGMMLSVYVFRRYGQSLFIGTPVVMGFIGGYIEHAFRGERARHSFRLAFEIVLATAATLVAFALEGALCLIILLPIALPLVWVGALLGAAAAPVENRLRRTTKLSALMVPALALFDVGGASPEYVVLSETTIDATPEEVWPRVIGFSELPPATDLFFRLGVAHPVRARLEGSGVGAVRYCEFSTGPFVEPITAWEPPHRLAFDVAEQPHPMRELSPWGAITPPHLEETLHCRRGEFRLVALPDGRTRLEGRTWYAMDLWPQAYFKLWADDLIHRIHVRVLDHIESLAEAPR